MACCDHNLSMDLPTAVLFNDTLSALKQVLKIFALSIEVELCKLKSLTCFTMLQQCAPSGPVLWWQHGSSPLSKWRERGDSSDTLKHHM